MNCKIDPQLRDSLHGDSDREVRTRPGFNVHLKMSALKIKDKKNVTSRKNDDDGDTAMPGYLISCDIPTKQYILYLNELKPTDKRFVMADLDSTHLLVKVKARKEIETKVETWQRENVFTSVEKVGEDLDVS